MGLSAAATIFGKYLVQSRQPTNPWPMGYQVWTTWRFERSTTTVWSLMMP
jgi:hypothetical protein